MSGWAELRDLGVVVRPFDGPSPTPGWKRSNFASHWTTTVALLARELRMLEAKRVVIELAVGEWDLRIDGMPKANARLAHQGLRISFESKFGPLRYETAEFDSWMDNVRAIALSLEALRKVDRYGVSKRGEQYRGWRALPMRAGEDSLATPLHAREFLSQWDGDVKRAIRETHPDRGGDEAIFRKVIRARELIGG